jgi:hypothetical protein
MPYATRDDLLFGYSALLSGMFLLILGVSRMIRNRRVEPTPDGRLFMPRSSPRRASSSKAIIFAMGVLSFQLLVQGVVGTGARDGRTPTGARALTGADHCG